jgi:hypothetical protein
MAVYVEVTVSDRSKHTARLFEIANQNESAHAKAAEGRGFVLDSALEQLHQLLKGEFQQQCDDLNREPQINNILTCSLEGNNWSIEWKAKERFVAVAFEPDSHRVRIFGTKPVGFSETVAVKEDQGHYRFVDSTGNDLNFQVGKIVEKALNSLLGIGRDPKVPFGPA